MLSHTLHFEFRKKKNEEKKRKSKFWKLLITAHQNQNINEYDDEEWMKRYGNDIVILL